MSEEGYKKTVVVEIDFEKPVCPWLVPSIVSNRDAVQILGANIEEVRLSASKVN